MGELTKYLGDDHQRLNELLNQAAAAPAAVEPCAYARFRSGLLRHIGIEERLLLPGVQRLGRREWLPLIERIRLDHGTIAALLVPPPGPGIIRALRSILQGHNTLEEGRGGFYEACEGLPAKELEDLLEKVRSAPEVRTQPNNPAPGVLNATRRALARAGYELDSYLSDV